MPTTRRIIRGGTSFGRLPRASSGTSPPTRDCPRHRTRVGPEDLPYLAVDRLLELRLVGERADHLGAEIVGRLDVHARHGSELLHDQVGEVEDTLAAHPHQRMNPRSRASFSFTFPRSRR